MAKKQAFGDKTDKQNAKKGTYVKVIRALKTKKGAISFKNEILLFLIKTKTKFTVTELAFIFFRIFLKQADWSLIDINEVLISFWKCPGICFYFF